MSDKNKITHTHTHINYAKLPAKEKINTRKRDNPTTLYDGADLIISCY